MKKSDRQLATILLLQVGRRRTAQELAEHFEVSKRTVYRDILALLEAGVPIVSLPGKGYEILNSYYLPPIRLTFEEATGLFIGSQLALYQSDASIRPNLQSAMLKIEAVLPEETRSKLEPLKEAIYLDGHQHRSGDKRRFLAPISKTISNRHVLKIRYRAFYNDNLTQREVEPLWLLYYRSHWHIIGYCRLRKDLRDFRVDRIEQLEVLEDKAPLREEFSLSRYLKQHERYREITEVKVRFSKRAARYVKEWLQWISYTEEEVAESVIITMLVENPAWMSRWVLGFGPEAEVLSPASLREEVKESARKILDSYEPQRVNVNTNRHGSDATVYSNATA